MSSTRLPGKVLMPLLGIPSILFMAKRVLRASKIDRVIIATSDQPSDDPLAKVLTENGLECFRGNLDDVLDRFYQAAVMAHADHVVRLTGDCPLIDADLIDDVVAPIAGNEAEYASNTNPATYPNGLDVEAFSMSALTSAWHEASLPSDREHVTPFLIRNSDRFKKAAVSDDVDRSGLRWTVDHPSDLARVRDLLAAIGAKDPVSFDRHDFYRAIEQNPALEAPSIHKRNDGYFKSLEEDARIKRAQQNPDSTKSDIA